MVGERRVVMEEPPMAGRGSASGAPPIVTAAPEDERNAAGMSYGCHISHKDFAA